MADPMSKPKAAKAKERKAPHVLQQQSKLTAIKVAQQPNKPTVQRNQGRGR